MHKGLLLAITMICASTAPALALAADPNVTIVKHPVNLTTQKFDPKRPPKQLPPLTPPEEAVCASDFLSDASVAASAEMTDQTHATATITKVIVTIDLDCTIWLPNKAEKDTVDHEEGHHQISEYYYKNAEAVARRVAEPYIGKKIPISGPDLRKALSAAIQQAATEITEAYNKNMPVEATQARYDAITDHHRNKVLWKDAVAQAIKETGSFPATQP